MKLLNVKLQWLVPLLMMFNMLLPALPAVADKAGDYAFTDAEGIAWFWYGPEDGLGGARRMGVVDTIPKLQAGLEQIGGGAGLKADLRWIVDNDPIFRRKLEKALATYGCTLDDWIDVTALLIAERIRKGDVRASTFKQGQKLLAVTSQNNAHNTVHRVWRPARSGVTKRDNYWGFHTLYFPREGKDVPPEKRTYGLAIDWAIPFDCGNLSPLGAWYRPPLLTKASPPSAQPPVAKAPPPRPLEGAPAPQPTQVNVGFTGSTAGGYEQHPQFAPIVQAPVLIPPVPKPAPVTVNQTVNVPAGTGPHGMITVSGGAVSTSVSSSSAAATVGGAGSAASAGQSSGAAGADGGSATVIF